MSLAEDVAALREEVRTLRNEAVSSVVAGRGRMPAVAKHCSLISGMNSTISRGRRSLSCKPQWKIRCS
jgi:hypothetical protein